MIVLPSIESLDSGLSIFFTHGNLSANWDVNMNVSGVLDYDKPNITLQIHWLTNTL